MIKCGRRRLATSVSRLRCPSKKNGLSSDAMVPVITDPPDKPQFRSANLQNSPSTVLFISRKDSSHSSTHRPLKADNAKALRKHLHLGIRAVWAALTLPIPIPCHRSPRFFGRAIPSRGSATHLDEAVRRFSLEKAATQRLCPDNTAVQEANHPQPDQSFDRSTPCQLFSFLSPRFFRPTPASSLSFPR